jgi:hypothetical protein
MRATLTALILSGALLLGAAADVGAQVSSRGTRLPSGDEDRGRDHRAPADVWRRDLPLECREWGWGVHWGRDAGRWDDDDRGERRSGRHPGRPVGWNDRDYDRWRRDYDRARRQHAELIRRLERQHEQWHRAHDHRRRDANLRRQHEALHRRLAQQHADWHRRHDPCSRLYDDWHDSRRVAFQWPGFGWPHRDLWSTLAALISPSHW